MALRRSHRRSRATPGLDAWSVAVGAVAAALGGVVILLAVIGPPTVPQALWLARRADLARSAAWLAIASAACSIVLIGVGPRRVRLALGLAWAITAAFVLWSQRAQAIAIFRAAW
ncbi:MAG TPA: hypothetical protein PKC43_00690 [Phycisphaerales bacterium]|nr:hypothetical protein [Phycisphaerales bacterium]HMP35942.1 hypothetical protein [Phycisphaerales bacterium]